MTVRTPIYMIAPVGQPQQQPYPFTTQMMNELKELAGYAFSINPNPYLEVNTGVGTALPGQPFVDTYYIAGASTSRVDRSATEAETPNISISTDNYTRITQRTDVVSLPNGDTNNLQYPLYFDGTDLRAMTVTDFIDTFITADVLAQFGGGGYTLAKGGTYYLTTNDNPPNATRVGTTFAARNSVADVAAYTRTGIPETTKQVINTDYYVAMNNYPPTGSGLYDNPIYDLPIYYDAGTETIKTHSAATWATLLNPFLRYFLSTNGGTAYALSYNIDGADGVANGSAYADTRTSGSLTGYATRFVNADDYRTQEFPNGTASTIATQSFKIHQGPITAAPVAMPNTPYVVTADSNGLGGSCTAQINVNSNGTITGTGTIGNPSSDGSLPQNWYTGGNPELYQVRWNYTANINGGTITSAGDNVWLGLNISRSWSIYDGSVSSSPNTMSGLMEIREISTGTVLASGTVYLSADQNP